MDEAQTPPASSGNRRKILIAVGSVAIIAIGVTAGVLIGGSGTKHPTALPSPTLSTPSAQVTQPTTPASSTSTAPPVPHEVVAAAAPTQFELKGPAFDIKAHVCGMLNVRPLDPPGEQHHTVCWVKDGFGVAPGTTSGTTYVLGHAWGQDDREVLNDLSEAAMKQVLKEENHPVQITGVDTFPVTAMNGYVLTLKTPKGTLNYTVKSVYAVRKAQAGNVKPLMDESTPNRVVIITCGELNHHDYDYNIIVNAYLSSSVATQA
jgi:hypothetical protein